MKIKFKDDWELDCLVIRKNGEKVTFKYEPLTDSLIKIVEVKEEELKELFNVKKISPISESEPTKDSSDKHPGCESFRPAKKNTSQNSRKMPLETIKKIKTMAEEGMGNKDIAKLLSISPQLVNYWRKNTPKELICLTRF